MPESTEMIVSIFIFSCISTGFLQLNTNSVFVLVFCTLNLSKVESRKKKKKKEMERLIENVKYRCTEIGSR